MFNSNTMLDKRVIKLVKYRMNSLLGDFFIHSELNHILFLLGRRFNDFRNFLNFQIPINSDKKFAPIAKTGQCGGTA